MLACLDVAYKDDLAFAACLQFAHWTSDAAFRAAFAQIKTPASYQSGAFYLRELPALRAVFDELAQPSHAIIVDGYVYLDRDGRPGLGARLYESLKGNIPVIGVAKTALRGDDWSIPVLRGVSRTPLRVTAIGMDQGEAAAHVRAMAGAYRIPEMLKKVDRLARDSAAQSAQPAKLR
jgi:deoxyribonuclease V